MHLDKDGIYDPQKYYKAAGLNNDKVEEIIRAFEKTMRHLHQDIRELAGLRDAASSRR